MSVATAPSLIVAGLDVFDRLEDAIRRIAPQADPRVWVPALKPAFLTADCVTPRRIAAILGQCRAEAGPAFNQLTENLNYSAEGLLRAWPKRFTPETASRYAHQPELIANLVYANRLGNGDVASGDGWRFRGHGLIQITGRDTFKAFAVWCRRTVEDAATWALQPDGAAITAAWFWNANKLNQHADVPDIDAITEAVNGKDASALTRQQRLAFSNAANGILTSGVLTSAFG